MVEPRRVRTQAERDADGTTWHPGGLVTGEPVHVELDPDECVLVIREGVGVMCVRDDHDPGRDLSPVARVMAGLDPDIWMSTESVNARPPRRRWWHRYTRRNP